MPTSSPLDTQNEEGIVRHRRARVASLTEWCARCETGGSEQFESVGEGRVCCSCEKRMRVGPLETANKLSWGALREGVHRALLNLVGAYVEQTEGTGIDKATDSPLFPQESISYAEYCSSQALLITERAVLECRQVLSRCSRVITTEEVRAEDHYESTAALHPVTVWWLQRIAGLRGPSRILNALLPDAGRETKPFLWEIPPLLSIPPMGEAMEEVASFYGPPHRSCSALLCLQQVPVKLRVGMLSALLQPMPGPVSEPFCGQSVHLEASAITRTRFFLVHCSEEILGALPEGRSLWAAVGEHCVAGPFSANPYSSSCVVLLDNCPVMFHRSTRTVKVLRPNRVAFDFASSAAHEGLSFYTGSANGDSVFTVELSEEPGALGCVVRQPAWATACELSLWPMPVEEIFIQPLSGPFSAATVQVVLLPGSVAAGSSPTLLFHVHWSVGQTGSAWKASEDDMLSTATRLCHLLNAPLPIMIVEWNAPIEERRSGECLWLSWLGCCIPSAFSSLSHYSRVSCFQGSVSFPQVFYSGFGALGTAPELIRDEESFRVSQELPGYHLLTFSL